MMLFYRISLLGKSAGIQQTWTSVWYLQGFVLNTSRRHSTASRNVCFHSSASKSVANFSSTVSSSFDRCVTRKKTKPRGYANFVIKVDEGKLFVAEFRFV
jgi:hypothetical protein